jgi:DNA-binding transcriptional LysR family regulator
MQQLGHQGPSGEEVQMGSRWRDEMDKDANRIRADATVLEPTDLDLIAAVAEAGGPRGAARALQVHAATVYRRLGALEARLGATLFERGGGRYRPTELGQEVIVAAQDNRLRLAELNRRISGAGERMAGWIAVTTTDSLAPIVSEAIARFRGQYPEVRIGLSLSNSFADMGRHEAELAIRPTRTPPETLVGRRAARFDYGVYARPGSPEAWVALDETLAAVPSARWLADRIAPDQVALKADSMWAAGLACAAGVGRAVLPSYVATGLGLERTEGPIPELASEVWLLTHEDLRRTPRIRALIAVAAEHLGAAIRPG